MCPEFGGEDNGDGCLCGKGRNQPVPVLYHLPAEPGECLRRVMPFHKFHWYWFCSPCLSDRLGGKLFGEKTIFC